MKTNDVGPLSGDASTPIVPYRPRHFQSLGVRNVGPVRVKLYSIRCDSAPMGTGITQAGDAYLDDRLADFVETEGDHHGLGFAILHEGQAATWLLVHWWAHADILCQRMAFTDASGAFVDTDRPFHGCVWEGVVFSHEHKAWVDSMLTAAPDAEGYLSALLPDGAY